MFFEAVDRVDVGMIQRCQEFRFPLKPGKTVCVLCELRRKRPDGDFAIQLGVARTPDLAHTALSQGGNDFIVADLGAGLDHP